MDSSTPAVRAPVGPLEAEAAAFAAAACAGQMRSGRRSIPVTAHFEEVAALMALAGASDSERAAGRLHDVVEDSSVTLAEIRERFGPEVAAIVDGMTDPPEFAGMPLLERKTLQAERIRSKPDAVKRGKIADQTSNLRSLAVDPPTGWPPEKCRAYAEGALRIVSACRGASPVLEALFDEAHAEVARVHGPFRPADNVQ
ncbi:HD domain-containing protein [Longimicrobium terrae]|uniref:Guanosine-3',5'-bis(Diphosphate) 3'-pyrophosphohydrolase n=1 Tax=Longimicrobium terrae TaxID=1639882 RepID=A0A841GUD0_9BACT|nr:HD domain-containing protein [Longimicrobium terrae]MBB4634557.1 guanosine-3',5'-bis(diphosphate) 3'-pyrophosphohydrolase [Longimicrobium terrae]MBB6068553.1 guanosine-3',5'-bis(diphosphate) 3'-pyrophosphohydrolase [Longimicrobium terrae]